MDAMVLQWPDLDVAFLILIFFFFLFFLAYIFSEGASGYCNNNVRRL